VEIKWRNTEGKISQSTFQLVPGWHTVQLDAPKMQVAGEMTR